MIRPLFPRRDVAPASVDHCSPPGLLSSRQQWGKQAGSMMLAVYRYQDELLVGILRVDSVAEDLRNEQVVLTVSRLQMADAIHQCDQLDWYEEFEITAEEVLYSESLRQTLTVQELPTYRKAIQRISTVAKMLELDTPIESFN